MILEAIKGRRSVRRFKAEAPGRDRIEALIEAALAAPSAGNMQPWRFLAVTGRGRISGLAAAVREAVARVAPHIEAPFQEEFRRYAENFTCFESAPVVIVPLCRRPEIFSSMAGPSLPDADRGRIDAMEGASGLISASLAVQNLLLMAHASGLGASVMTGPLIAEDRLRALLEVPPSWDMVAVIPVGFPDESPAPPPRKPVGSILRWVE